MNKRRFLITFLRGNYGKLFGVFFFAICAVILNLISPMVLSSLFDYVLDQQPITNPFIAAVINALGGATNIREHLWIGGVVLIGIHFATAIALFLRQYLSGVVSENMSNQLRNRLYEHLQKLPYSYHVQSKTGELIQRCTSDVDMIRRVFGQQLQQLIRSIFIVSIAIVILFQIHARLAFQSMILMPFLFLYAFFFYRKNQKAFLDSDEAEARMTAAVQENLSGIRVVKAFGREAYEESRFDKYNEDYRSLTFRMMKLLGVYWSTSDVLSMLQMMIVVFAGIMEARNGSLSIGNFFLFVNYESMILWPLRQMGRILADFGKSSVAMDRLIEILKVEEEDFTSGLTPEISGDIVFDHVSFQYDDGNTEVLKDVSFHIPQGHTVAIIGPTGSGKSSLVHLLSRLYDYKTGSILIDGVELREIQKEYLRKQVGIVLQEPFLFSKTIYENIHLSNPESSKEDVEHAARIAAIHDVIEEFDQGYDTMVGEKGVTLSGGQKQRIAIARTILNQQKIIIFDDSLSAVDTETDAQIRNALNQLRKKATTIIITQRISSAKDADQIYVLEDGRITQSGTHMELIGQEGLYKRIYEIQSSYVEKGENE